MLDADTLGVVGPIARVPGDILFPYTLVAVAGAVVINKMRCDSGTAILKPGCGAGRSALYFVYDNVIYRVTGRPAGGSVVTGAGRSPRIAG